MEIKDLKPGMSNVDIEAEVKEVGEVREFQKFGKTGRVATAKIDDGTGEIPLSLWNEQIDKVKEGTKVKITNGYVNEWQNKPQLTAGKFGTVEILEG